MKSCVKHFVSLPNGLFFSSFLMIATRMKSENCYKNVMWKIDRGTLNYELNRRVHKVLLWSTQQFDPTNVHKTYVRLSWIWSRRTAFSARRTLQPFFRLNLLNLFFFLKSSPSTFWRTSIPFAVYFRYSRWPNNHNWLNKWHTWTSTVFSVIRGKCQRNARRWRCSLRKKTWSVLLPKKSNARGQTEKRTDHEKNRTRRAAFERIFHNLYESARKTFPSRKNCSCWKEEKWFINKQKERKIMLVSPMRWENWGVLIEWETEKKNRIKRDRDLEKKNHEVRSREWKFSQVSVFLCWCEMFSDSVELTSLMEADVGMWLSK